MDLTFSELDEYNFQDSGFDHNNFNENNNSKNDVININTNLTTYTNYWHNNEEQDNLKKNSTIKPLTYDDILNSLNLKAKNGNLEFIEKKNQIVVKKQAVTFDPTLNINLNINVKKQQDNHVQMPEIDKNSYIYNKYFKNYKDESTVEQPKKPLTREEYIQEYNRQIYEKKRIEQIKSKKLMFSRGNDVNISVSNPNHNLNKLFRM